MRKTNKNNKIFSRTAGDLMISDVPLVSGEQTIEEVEKLILKNIKGIETINYVYVIDNRRKLTGVFSIKEIFRRKKGAVVSEIMIKDLVKCRTSTRGERVAMLALKNNLKAIPVIGKDDRFIGVVTSDVILEILHQEYLKDILLVGGIGKHHHLIKSLSSVKAWDLVKIRVPWLIIGLLGGVAAAQIIGFFEEILKAQILLALFIPVIVYLSDAVATQTETLIIRGLAIDHNLVLRKYILKEIKVGGFLALILASLLSIFVLLWWGNFFLAVILGISLFFSVFFSVAIAMFIPLVLLKTGRDPALGSGPIATIITDILSIIVYFGVANIFILLFL